MATRLDRARRLVPHAATLLLATLILAISTAAQAASYLSTDEFVASSFATPPSPAMLWLKAPEQEAAKKFLGHKYAGLRLRYWQQGTRTAWILDEIGKERPITMGFVIDNQQISRVAILEYRESRGGEVRHPFFTDQFVGAQLADEDYLSTSIDGISGATMSVRAVTNSSRFALFLHDQVTSKSKAKDMAGVSHR